MMTGRMQREKHLKDKLNQPEDEATRLWVSHGSTAALSSVFPQNPPTSSSLPPLSTRQGVEGCLSGKPTYQSIWPPFLRVSWTTRWGASWMLWALGRSNAGPPLRAPGTFVDLSGNSVLKCACNEGFGSPCLQHGTFIMGCCSASWDIRLVWPAKLVTGHADSPTTGCAPGLTINGHQIYITTINFKRDHVNWRIFSWHFPCKIELEFQQAPGAEKRKIFSHPSCTIP